MTDRRRAWRQWLNPQTLRAQVILFMMLPVLVLLTTVSMGGFLLVREALIKQWGQTAIATLQQTAHLVDMQLHGSKELLRLLQSNDYSPDYRETFDTVVQRLLELESVLEVRVEWPEKVASSNSFSGRSGMMGGRRHGRFHLGEFTTSNPMFDESGGGRVINLVSKFLDEKNENVGQLEIVFSFDVLVNQIRAAKWWQSNRAYLLNEDGEVLASASDEETLEHQFPRRVFGGLGALEARTWEAISKGNSGTIFDKGLPPREVSGFYRLQEMKWVIVIISPGELILKPLVRFRNLYILSFAVSIILVALLLLRVTSRVNARITTLSQAAADLSAGRFGLPLPEIGRDEVTDLTRNFNRMSAQLEQRLSMKKAINIAREVQQNLLPEQVFQRGVLQIAGTCRFCDETGGDYYDLLTFREDLNRVGVAIGDAIGHGVGAALLMTTIRALLRCRLAMGGSLGEIMTEVNRLLCLDTVKSGRFITLFYLEVDIEQRIVWWVRAGHDSVLLYLPEEKRFEDLRGEGIVLGVDDERSFIENSICLGSAEALICLATDGVFELSNEEGDVFGRERLQQGLSRYAVFSPEQIVSALLKEMDAFRGNFPQNDDITLVVIKLAGESLSEVAAGGNRSLQI